MKMKFLFLLITSTLWSFAASATEKIPLFSHCWTIGVMDFGYDFRIMEPRQNHYVISQRTINGWGPSEDLGTQEVVLTGEKAESGCVVHVRAKKDDVRKEDASVPADLLTMYFGERLKKLEHENSVVCRGHTEIKMGDEPTPFQSLACNVFPDATFGENCSISSQWFTTPESIEGAQ